MPSFKTAALAVAAALFATAQADYVINVTAVPLSVRKSWCASEISTCPLICEQTPPGTTLDNSCDPEALTYGCLCGNNLQPNVSEYSLTLPYFVCQEWGNQCVTGCGADNECSSACRQDHPCGAQNPTRANTTSTTSTVGATGTAAGTATGTNQVYDGFGDSSATSTPSSGSGGGSHKSLAASLDSAGAYSMVVVVAGLFAGFGFML